ncbi:MAG: hypothetical protein JSR99_08545 [Proteobacteria bacterium]|nr:hypothetical protein [Pseudomonadota bacterium]
MQNRSIILRAALLWLAAASVMGVMNSGEAWAKHKKVKTSAASKDPCAEPAAFINEHIKKIHDLQDQEKARSVSSIAGFFQSRQHENDETSIKISELRHDAEGVNELLRAGGCKTVDIDHQLRKSASH